MWITEGVAERQSGKYNNYKEIRYENKLIDDAIENS